MRRLVALPIRFVVRQHRVDAELATQPTFAWWRPTSPAWGCRFCMYQHLHGAASPCTVCTHAKRLLCVRQAPNRIRLIQPCVSSVAARNKYEAFVLWVLADATVHEAGAFCQIGATQTGSWILLVFESAGGAQNSTNHSVISQMPSSIVEARTSRLPNQVLIGQKRNGNAHSRNIYETFPG